MNNWQETIKRSKYHFDSFKTDKEVDKINKLGRFIGSVNENLDKIKNLLVLDSCTDTVKTLNTQEVIDLTLDNLHDIAPDNPWRVVKIIVHLTDWEPGHFCNYGNYMHYQWRAGDVYSYDWQNIPYSFANAGKNPISTYQLTGVLNEQSDGFINRLKRFNTYNLDL